MKFGNYDCLPLETGEFALDGGAMFGVVPKVLWEKKIPPDELNRIPMVTRSLLIRGNNRVILVDTGAGDNWEEKHRKIYKIDMTEVNLDRSLTRHGLSRDDITDVIITHLHFDHTGGSVIISDDGVLPAFSNATYYVQRTQWEAATHPSPKDKSSFIQQNFVPLKEMGMVEFPDGETVLFPGIEILVSNGHTTGQQHPLIHGDNSSLFFCGDMIPTSAHLPIPWVMAYDNYPLTTIDEKKVILRRAPEENWVLFFEHDPFIQAASVKDSPKGVIVDNVLQL